MSGMSSTLLILDGQHGKEGAWLKCWLILIACIAQALKLSQGLIIRWVR
jgi:hypothetical protein